MYRVGKQTSLNPFFVVCKADFVRRKALPTSDVKARLQPCIIKHLLAQE